MYSKTVCRICDKVFIPNSSNQRKCPDCMKLTKSGKPRQIGVGTGNYAKGENNPNFKHGKYAFSAAYLAHLGKDNWFCERCGYDLREIVKTKEGHGHWSVHHLDENRENQEFDNLELLCVTCHNNHHKHWEHNWVSLGKPKPKREGIVHPSGKLEDRGME